MKSPNQNSENTRRDRLVELYVEGLDERDDQKIAYVLAAALEDARLDGRLDEINAAYLEEFGLSEFGELPLIVRELMRETLPSAFEEKEKELPSLTVGDVAKQLDISRKVPPRDEDANRSLLENRTPLPGIMSLNEIKRLASELKISASYLFWRKFQGAAMFLRSNRNQESALLAARRKRLKKQREKYDEPEKKTRNK